MLGQADTRVGFVSDVAVCCDLCDVVLSRLNILRHSLLQRAYARTCAYRAKASTKLLGSDTTCTAPAGGSDNEA